MRRLKAAVNFLMGLLFMVQGAAVAGAPITISKIAEAPAALHTHCQSSHDQVPAPAEKSCCCHHACPAMAFCSACALTAVSIDFTAAFPAPFVTGALQSPPVVGAVLSAAPNSLLRPPISLHG